MVAWRLGVRGSGRDPQRDLGRPGVGQVVLPVAPRGSPAAREWQVNIPLTRNNDLPYGFGVSADSVPHPTSLLDHLRLPNVAVLSYDR